MFKEKFGGYEDMPVIEKEPVEKLFDAMKQMADKQNEYFRKNTNRKIDKNGVEEEMVPVLDDRCQVNPHCFHELFKEDFLPKIDYVVEEFENRKCYAELFPEEHRKEARRLWREKKERGIPNQWEMALATLLDKTLGDEFMVIRSSTYDDISHGVDTLIIHKASNTVVCALDEVSDYSGIDDKRNDDKFPDKEKKVFNIMEKGHGTRAEYVPIIIDRGLMIRDLKNAPLFYLGIRKAGLKQLLQDIEPGADRLNLTEDSTFKNIMESIKKQMENYKKFMNPGKKNSFDNRLIKNLEKMEKMILIMEAQKEKVKPRDSNDIYTQNIIDNRRN